MKTQTLLVLAASSLLLGFAAGVAVGQATPPMQNRAIGAVQLQSLDLTDEIDSVFRRPLRLRKITLQPGGIIGLHSHRPGQGFAEGKATTHWAENRGSVPAVWIAVDIPKEP